MKTFLRLLEFARPHRKFWPRYLIVSILSVIFGIVYYALLEPLLTVLFLPENIDLTATLPQFTLSVDYFKSAFRFYLGNFMQNYGLLTGLVYVCLVLILTSFISNLLRYLSQ